VAAVTRRSSRLVGIFAAALVATASGGCSDSPLPGSLLGTYTVTGHLATNSCGLPAPDPWIFDVQLSESSMVLYWSYMDGTPILSSPLSSQSEAVLLSGDVENVDPTDAGAGPCTMQRSDRIDITLNGSSPPNQFQGTLGYSFTATTESNCSDQLAAAGGQYQALPCGVSYSLTGLRQ
jgi:hypothetical protein